MTTNLTLRSVKGSGLTLDEMDTNLVNLRTTADAAKAATDTLTANKAEAAALGVSNTDQNMGSFTGTTIADNVTAKAAIQSLETAVETKSNASAVGVAASAANMGTYTGSTISDNQTAKQNLQELETAVEARASKAGDTFTGAVSLTAGISGSLAAPVFTSGAYRSYHTFNSGGLDFAAEYAAEQAGLAATDSVTAALKITSGTIHQTNTISAYMESSRAKPETNGGDVALYTHAKAKGNNANVFSLNTLASDTAGFTGQTLQNELDINVFDPSTNVQGLGLVLNSIQTMVNAPLGYVCRIANSTQWGACFYTTDGASQIAYHAGALGTGNNVYSQVVEFVSRSAGGTTYTSSVRSDPNASLLLQSGAVGAAIGFQDSAGTNMGFVNGSGLTTATVSADSSSSTALAALSLKNASTASVTTKGVSAVFKGADTAATEKTGASIVVDPADVNWVGSKLTINIRKGDAIVPFLTLGAPSGSPEGVITSSPGAIYTTDGGAMYLKASGSGNTGWVAK